MAKKVKDNKETLNFAAVNAPLMTPSGIGIATLTDFDVYTSGSKWVKWGFDNRMPQIYFDNYLKCGLFSSIVNRITDFTFGNGVDLGSDVIFKSDTDDSIDDIVRKCIFDYILFGGFTLECIRNNRGSIVRYNYLNVMNVRIDEKLEKAYISKKWTNYSSANIVELPLYNKDEKQPHFVYYYRGNITRGINPIPSYIASLKSIEILCNTRNFHLRNLENGFSASVIINLNDGNIKTAQLNEIKKKLEEGYTGSANAGKFLLMNGGDKEHEATVARIDADNFGDLYKALSESSESDVMTAFGINEMLLGRNVKTGFSKEEFENAYALFYETNILPIQNSVKKEFGKIGVSFEFKPFEIKWRD